MSPYLTLTYLTATYLIASTFLYPTLLAHQTLASLAFPYVNLPHSVFLRHRRLESVTHKYNDC